ncbi:hypothetical protein BaRGS_00009978 [Batillaria attramentaria]|uniref:Uncharacterized protein n=1 Tax=Batillaria attramentaria TaxID=370345 RepID=A0ABD0LI27_9CAEN
MEKGRLSVLGNLMKSTHVLIIFLPCFHTRNRLRQEIHGIPFLVPCSIGSPAVPVPYYISLHKEPEGTQGRAWKSLLTKDITGTLVEHDADTEVAAIYKGTLTGTNGGMQDGGAALCHVVG